jgi:hypothetical protein
VTRSAKPATVRFYFDADILGLAKVVAPLRYDATYPGDPGGVVTDDGAPRVPLRRLIQMTQYGYPSRHSTTG